MNDTLELLFQLLFRDDLLHIYANAKLFLNISFRDVFDDFAFYGSFSFIPVVSTI